MHGALGRAEVNELDLAVVGDGDVVGADIAVDHILVVHSLQGGNHLCQNGPEFLPGDMSAPAVQEMTKVTSVNVLHGIIGRIVVLTEQVVNAYDVGMVLEAVNGLGFVDKVLTEPLIGFFVSGCGNQVGAARGSGGDGQGVILLQSSNFVLFAVPHLVGNTETAFTQYLIHPVPAPDHSSNF